MSKLPTIQEIRENTEIAFRNDQLNAILNVEPPTQWIKKHPFAKSVNYLPIDKVEYLMTKIFQVWNTEVLSVSQLFNSVSVTVRVHYQDPITNQMRFHDGVGAVGIQTDKGESASNMNAIKSDAVMKALPAAKSYAIKDACEHIGKIFGRDLNRPDAVEFKAPIDPYTELSDLYFAKCEILNEEDRIAIGRIIEEKEHTSYSKAIKILKAI